jgi:hypothetical protein
MERHRFLAELHRRILPRTYLEIGVNDGRSLALSRAPSIAVDPAFRITVPFRCDVQVVKARSDAFFARPDPLRHLRSSRNPFRNLARGRPLFGAYLGPFRLDLAFIDGMHLFEYALRDLMNIERHADWWTVIVVDDMLPRNAGEAARGRHTREWAGDVYKLAPILAQHRPDLLVIPVDTTPTGVVVILGADPSSRILVERYDEIVATWATPDPQQVPPEVLGRDHALDPSALLGSNLWPELVRARRWRRARGTGLESLRRALARVGP